MNSSTSNIKKWGNVVLHTKHFYSSYHGIAVLSAGYTTVTVANTKK